jgi:hypothetical protein
MPVVDQVPTNMPGTVGEPTGRCGCTGRGRLRCGLMEAILGIGTDEDRSRRCDIRLGPRLSERRADCLISARITCEHCAEVIGVYEPAVVVSDCEVHETSRAAEPGLTSEAGELYHRACYLELFAAN